MNQRFGEERLESSRAFLGSSGVQWIEADGIRYYLEDEEVRRHMPDEDTVIVNIE
jgi:hypothetical protein